MQIEIEKERFVIVQMHQTKISAESDETDDIIIESCVCPSTKGLKCQPNKLLIK